MVVCKCHLYFVFWTTLGQDGRTSFRMLSSTGFFCGKSPTLYVAYRCALLLSKHRHCCLPNIKKLSFRQNQFVMMLLYLYIYCSFSYNSCLRWFIYIADYCIRNYWLSLSYLRRQKPERDSIFPWNVFTS